MPTIQAQDLQPIIASILEAAGALPDYAEIVSTHLVNANLAGHDSHGVIRTPYYVKSIDSGKLDPKSLPAVVKETASIAQIDGKNTFGQVTAKFGTELAIKKARVQGVALVTVFQIGHTGRLGTYAEMAAKAGHGRGDSGMVVSAARARFVIPFNGSGRKLGANPIAMGFPSDKHGAVVLDFATSMSAAGKVMVAEAKGESLPAEWIVDAERTPDRRPDQTQRRRGFASAGHAVGGA